MGVTASLKGGVGQVVLNDPPLNLLTRSLMAELRERLAELGREERLRVLILHAEGKHFSAGAAVDEHLPDQVDAMIPEFMETIGAVRDFPLPVIAAVQGRCLGGAFELILGADLIIAAEDALLGVPEIQLGVFPPAVCLQLPRWGAPPLAAELVYTGDPQRASVLADAGIVRRVVPGADLLREATTLAEHIARNSGSVLRVTKRALRAGTRALDGAVEEVTRIYLDELMATEDAIEGLTSFLEKRVPEWRHR